MIRYAVHHKKNIYFKRNESKRVRALCIQKNCPFCFYASWEDRFKCFQLKTMITKHRCNSKFKLRVVSQKWIQEKYEDKVRDDPCIGYVALKDLIETELGIHISTSMVRRAVRCIKKRINASFEEQFNRLRDYDQELLDSIPNTTMKIMTSRVVDDGPCMFQRIYCCFGAMKRGFLEGYRKIVGLDGCFLKGLLKGEILTAVGRDANNNMYPIAWAIVEIENTSSWAWFIELLKHDLEIDDTSPWTVISDQQKGLTNVIQTLLPQAEHRNCARHIHANWSKNHRGKYMKQLFWMCARSTCQSQLQEWLQELKKKDVAAKQDLENYPFKTWCKAFIRTSVKCDAVDNNMSEAFNRTLVGCRSKPIIPMLDDIQIQMMQRIAKKRDLAAKWKGRICPNIKKILNTNILRSSKWRVVFNGDDGYEVKKGKYQYKVKLEGDTCSCRSWELTGIPCQHAICAMFDQDKDPESYIDDCYSIAAFRRTYSYTLEPINGEMAWPRVEGEKIHPPAPKKMIGRPKKKRTREESEPPAGKLSRKGRVMTCSHCKQKGHQKHVCPTAPQGS
ncbi:unnamed protein product [Cuscuta epithymum]|uniref:SWIM-type domain-containing protein n=1 Tax=Cuscuta epithymum TaxID=186058 RepID=A0AAV0F161_9ASTE|nr:unnamed protein product [Cuscuta epithymum]